MGGEPTFVSVDDRDGAEWNTDGARARPSARSPPSCSTGCKRQVRAAGPAALRPGQVVSGRAAAALVAQLLLAHGRRADLAEPGAARRREHATTASTADAARRVPRAASRERLGLSPRSTSSRRTKTRSTTCGASAGCRPTSIRSIRSSTIRWSARGCAQVFEQGLDAVVGHVLPVSRDADGDALAERRRGSCARERCYLMPGDSPMGYRLPLDSLPWVDEERLPVHARSRIPTRAAAPLPRCARDPPAAARDASRARPRATPHGGSRARDRRRRRRARRRCESAASDHAHRACAPSRATACSTSSCRRPTSSRTTSSWSPRSRPPRAELRHAGGARRLRAAERSAPATASASRPTRA